jgi:8-oxo-dGTP pyrophosphatase MutT (NUDIX family)
MKPDRNNIIKNIIDNYAFHFSNHSKVMVRIRDLWNPTEDMTSRKTYPAHITASAILLRSQSVLMIRHKVLGKWLFPGGHIDKNELPHEAAARELSEETGYCVIASQAELIDIDCHQIPENLQRGEPEHHHIDLRYIFSEASGSDCVNEQEIESLCWVSQQNIPDSMVRISQYLNAR